MKLLKGVPNLNIADTLKNVPEDKVKLLFHNNFALWANYSGMQLDGHKFSFEGRKYLLPIYLDESKEIVWLKAAQTGATIYMLLRLLWFCRYHQVNAALYFPTDSGVKELSKGRFGPMIESNPEFKSSLANEDSLGLKQINNVHGGVSNLYLKHLGGVASKDSTPLDIVAFDEVRLVESEEIDQTLERISASKYRNKLFMSTCESAGLNIHKRFLGGTQSYWVSRCGCSDGIVLAESFPECIVEHKGETYYRCPRCKYRIYDPQNGSYIARNPGAPYPSYHVSQLVVNNLPPAEIWRFFNETSNKKEFWNAKLGLPYSDPENIPITQEVLDRCIDPNLKWHKANNPASGSGRAGGYVMGVDQMHGYCYVVIGRKGEDGNVHIVHYEIIEMNNPKYGAVSPFRRIHQLVNEYNIVMGVVDAQPGFNEAAELARAFPGRIFLAYYTYGGQDMVRWADRPKEKATIRKGGKEIKLPFLVVINRYQAIDYVTREIQQGAIRFPNPDDLVSLVKHEKTGRFENENICRTRFFRHLCAVERMRDYNREGGMEKLVWKEHEDPHSLHALVYMMIALGRARRAAKLLSWD